MTLSGVQRPLLCGLVVALVAAAVLALIVVLTGDLGTTEGRILATCLSFAAFCLAGMAAAVPPNRPRAEILRPIGLGASGIAFGISLSFIWGEIELNTNELLLAKAFVIATTIAVAAGHAALLLRGAGRSSASDAVITGTLLCTGAIVVLVALIVVAEWLPDGTGRALGALAILATLGTLLTPLLPKLLSSIGPEVR